jgi:hypothetical protein
MSRPRLSEKLAALLKSQDNPIIGPKTATELRNWLTAQPEPAMATTDDVDEHVTALSLVLKERPGTTKLEAGARLDLYARALKGVAKADLARGTDDLPRPPADPRPRSEVEAAPARGRHGFPRGSRRADEETRRRSSERTGWLRARCSGRGRVSARAEARVAAAREVADFLDSIGEHKRANDVRSVCRSNDSYRVTLARLHSDNMALRREQGS